MKKLTLAILLMFTCSTLFASGIPRSRLWDETDLTEVTPAGELQVRDDDVNTALASIVSGQLPDGHNVTVDNGAGAAAVNIQDGGNSITVDGTFTPVGTQDVQGSEAEGSGSLPQPILVGGDDGTDIKNINVDATTGDVQVDVTNTVTVDGSGVTQPISAVSLPLPTGASTSANQLPDGHNVTVDNASGASAVNIQDGGNSITVDGTVSVTEPVTVDNAGTFAVQADSVIPGVGATNLGKAEDAPHSSGDIGVAMLGVYNTLDDTGIGADTDGDYVMPRFDVRGRLRVSPGSLFIIDTFTATTGWGVVNDATANIATDLFHVLAANSLEFDKVDGSGFTDAMIEKTVPSFNAFALVTGAIFIQFFVNLPDVSDVVNYIVRMGTDSSNYNEWRIDATKADAGHFEVIRILLARPTGFAGNGINLTAVTYVAVGIEFGNESDELVDILWDGLLLNSGQVNEVDITTEGSADVRLVGFKSSNVSVGAGNVHNTKTQRITIATDDVNQAAIKIATEAIQSGQLPDGHNVTVQEPLTVDTTGTSGLEVVQDTAADLNMTEVNSAAILADTAIMSEWDNTSSDGASVTGSVAHDGVGTSVEPVAMGGYAIDYEPDTEGEQGRTEVSTDEDVTRLAVNRRGEVIEGVNQKVELLTGLDAVYDGIPSTNTETDIEIWNYRYASFCLDIDSTNTPTDFLIEIKISSDGTNYQKLMNNALGDWRYDDTATSTEIFECYSFEIIGRFMEITVTGTGLSGANTFTTDNSTLYLRN